LNFRKPYATRSGAEFATGYLDDMLIISFGNSDESSHLLEVGVDEVLRGHEMCEEVMSDYYLREAEFVDFEKETEM
jgi:hypothetical protein